MVSRQILLCLLADAPVYAQFLQQGNKLAGSGAGALKKLAAELLACDDIRIARAVASEALDEVACDEKTIP